jgi:hypothetical protein
MKLFKRYYIILFILLIPVSSLIFYISPKAPDFIETFYSNVIFKLFSQGLSLFTGLFPFSIAEFGLIFLILFVPGYLIYTIVKIIKHKKDWKCISLRFLKQLIITISLGYFVFVFGWTLNYSRLPFYRIAGLDIHPASVNELTDMCKKLIEQANDQRSLVHEDQNGVMYIPGGYKYVFKQVLIGYEKAAKVYPALGGKYGRPKSVFFSKQMSYTGIIGVYCPWTAEANVDTDITYPELPNTICHEMAHQHGFAREDEANYIAYLTCNMNPDPDIQYSGTYSALIYSMNALYDHDKDRYSKLRENYSAGINRDLAYVRKYWKGFEGPVENKVNSLNDAYLKANMQNDGVYSYGRMVDLLIAEFRKNGLSVSN